MFLTPFRTGSQGTGDVKVDNAALPELGASMPSTQSNKREEKKHVDMHTYVFTHNYTRTSLYKYTYIYMYEYIVEINK